MKRMTIYILLCALFLGVMPLNAQEPELTKEITVETDFVPVEQKVTKLNVLPDVTKTTVPKKTLAYTDWAGTVDIPYTINKFEPYGFNTKHEYSKAKGYFDFGAGSQLNVVGSAGYKLIDDEKMSLNAWIQHTSTWLGKNSSPLAKPEPEKQKFNDNVVGVNFSHKFEPGVLDLGAYYHYDRFNYYGANYTADYPNLENQTVNEFAIKAGWQNPMSVRRNFMYSAQLMFNHFGFSNGLDKGSDGLQENTLYAKISLGAKHGTFSFGLDAEGDYLSYSNIPMTDEDDNDWVGLVKVSPYFSYHDEKLHFRGGVNVDLSANDGSSVKVSPNVKVDYKVIDGISVYADVLGGKHLNKMSDYYAMCRYIAPNMALGSTNIPIDVEAGAKFGPFSGFYLKPFIGYGAFKNVVTPYIEKETLIGSGGYSENYLATPFVTMWQNDIKGWKAEVELGYKYNDLLALKLDVQYSPQDLEEGYMLGLDRAETVADVELKVTPIAPLSIILNFDWRTGRKYYSYYGLVGTPEVQSWGETTLEDVSNLSAEIRYRVNRNMGVFVHAGNLLNKQWDIFYGMGAQKINVLAGVNILFQ